MERRVGHEREQVRAGELFGDLIVRQPAGQVQMLGESECPGELLKFGLRAAIAEDGQLDFAAERLKAGARAHQPVKALRACEATGGDDAQRRVFRRKEQRAKPFQIDAVINQVRALAGCGRQALQQALHRGAIAEGGEGNVRENLREMPVVILHLMRVDADAEADAGEPMHEPGDLGGVRPVRVEMAYARRLQPPREAGRAEQAQVRVGFGGGGGLHHAVVAPRRENIRQRAGRVPRQLAAREVVHVGGEPARAGIEIYRVGPGGGIEGEGPHVQPQPAQRQDFPRDESLGRFREISNEVGDGHATTIRN